MRITPIEKDHVSTTTTAGTNRVLMRTAIENNRMLTITTVEENCAR